MSIVGSFEQRKLCRTFLREFRRLGHSFRPAPPAAFPLLASSSKVLAEATPDALQAPSKQPFVPWARSLLRDELRWNKKAKPSLAVLLGGGSETSDALDFLRQQYALGSCTSASEEGGLRVNAVSGFIESKSDAAKNKYVFAYNMSITNVGKQPLRILSRQYEFHTEGGGEAQQVMSDHPETAVETAGLVGYTPLLEPGQRFEFGSGTVLRSPKGSLTGEFLVTVEPEGLGSDDARVHSTMEDQELMLRYAYFKGLDTERFRVPLGRLHFDASVPCAVAAAAA